MKNLILTLLKVLLAGLLVWFVISQIETQDRLQPAPTSAEEESPAAILGSFTSDWRADNWTFLAENEEQFHGPTEEGWILQPGFFTAMRSLKWSWFLLGVLMWWILLLFGAWRWRMLLTAAEVPVTYRESLRLTLIGYFFNNVMLGATGGDLVRAVMVTRGLDSNRMRAALSVLVDRLIGLFALMLIAGCALSSFWAAHRISEIQGLREITGTVYLLLLCAVIGVGVYLSQRARKALGLDWILSKLPAQKLVQNLDESILVYRQHKGAVIRAVALSIPLQVSGILSFWAIGLSLGSSLTLAEDFVIFPVVQTVSALPLAPAGWGIGESLFGSFFRSFGSSFTLGVAVSVLFRLTSQVGFGLIGGIIWVTSNERRQGIPLSKKES